MARDIKKSYKSDAGFNFDRFSPKGGNIGNIDMSDFQSKSSIMGKSPSIGKKMSSSRNKFKVKNEKEDSLLSKLYAAFSGKSSSYDPTESNRAGQKMGQRMAGGMMKKYTKGGMNKYNKGSMLGDLDKNGVMSGYEQKRQDAIEKAMENKNMSGGMAKKKMMGGGMMQYNEGTGKKGVTVQARGCGQAVNKRKTRIT